MPRARGASKLANGVPLDSLAPGEKRALGLGPEGFPLDGEALAETGLDKPLVSLGPDGKPVLSPAAAEEVARVSPELARRIEATERHVSEQPGAAEGDPEAAGGTGGGMPDGPGGAVAGNGAAPPAGPPLSKPKAAPAEPTKGQRVSFLRDGVEVTGEIAGLGRNGRILVQTEANGVVVIERGQSLQILPKQETGSNDRNAIHPAPTEAHRTGDSGSPESQGTNASYHKPYSVFAEVKLNPEDYGRSEKVHFNRANDLLHRQLLADPEFSARMEKLIPGITRNLSSKGGRETPRGFIWHHDRRDGIMQLVQSSQHDSRSPFWRTLHPDPGARGGYAMWAIPAGAPPRQRRRRSKRKRSGRNKS